MLSRIVLVSVCVSLLASCGMFVGKRRMAPNSPIADSGIKDLLEAEMRGFAMKRRIKAYFKATTPPDRKKLIRNEIVSSLMYLIDSEYEEFADELLASRALYSTLGDVFAAGLSMSATLVDHTGTSDLLAGLSTVVTGARASLDKNFFFDQTTPVLIAQMTTLRRKERKVVDKGYEKTTDEYPLGTALSDVARYYLVGTIPQALAAISKTVGREDEESPFIGIKARLSASPEKPKPGEDFIVSFSNKLLPDQYLAFTAIPRFKGKRGLVVPLVMVLDGDGNGSVKITRSALRLADTDWSALERVTIKAPTSKDLIVTFGSDEPDPEKTDAKTPDTKTPEAKTPEAKKTGTKKTGTKKTDTKKTDTKKTETKKTETKNTDTKTPDARKPDTKKPETKKSEADAAKTKAKGEKK